MNKFAYIPQEKQAQVLSCGADEILYGGAAGGGKSYCLIMDYANHAITAECDGKKSTGVLFRRTFRELEDLVQKSMDIYLALGWKFSRDKMFWVSPAGSRLYLSYLDSMDDAQGHRGFEYDWIGFDELTLWPTDAEYVFLGTRLRSSSGVRLRRVSTTNPGGPGHLWVKQRWSIGAHPHGMVPLKEKIALADGREITKTRIFIPAKLKDNKYLHEDGHYEADLRTKPEHLQKMLLEGRWDVTEGAFFTEWNPDVHITRPFKLDASWRRWMAGDWGSSRPYAFLWFCQAPDGTIYLYRELYGDGGKANVGTYESPLEVADRIRTLELVADEYITERYLDASSWDGEHIIGQQTVADQFAQRGIHFQKSIKHNKAASVGIARDWLKVVNGRTRFKVFSHCKYFIEIIPNLQIDKVNPEQYQKDGENHIGDAWMYGCRRNLQDPNDAFSNRKVLEINQKRMRQWGQYGAQ